MSTMLSLGIVLIGGLAAERLVDRYKIPAISSYIFLGIFLGPHAFDLLSADLMEASDLLSNIVLGFIAFQIGKNFSIKNFKVIGKVVISLSLAETAAAWLFVTTGIYFLAGQPVHLALIYGAISAATAPAATMMVVRQYRARGAFTDIMLGIVAIDDAWGIIVFSLSLSIAKVFQAGHYFDGSVFFAALGATVGVLFCIALGLVFALIVSRASIYFKLKGDVLTFILGAVLLNTGIALLFDLSPLLSNMALGAALVNIDKEAFKYFDTLKAIDWPLYILFYAIAGANLEINLLLSLGLIGSVYLVFRVIGKIAGAYCGALIVKSPRAVRNYMGLALMPQAGVALGLAMVAKASFPVAGAAIFSAITATTVIYELFGPMATRYALSKAGEIE